MKNMVSLIALLIVLHLQPSPSQAHPNIIKDIKIEHNKLSIWPHSSFTKEFLKEPVFVVTYEEDIHLNFMDFTIQTIPFILCIIPLIWVSGKQYSIKAMDEDLFYSLEKIHHVFKLFYPSIDWSGALIPDKLIKNNLKPKRERNVGILFSGGLDSVTSSFNHLDKKQLLITIYGCDIPYTKKHLWQQVKKQAVSFAKQYGHNNSFLTFNFYSILNRDYLRTIVSDWWGYTSGSLSHAGLVAPILYSRGYPTLFAASSNTFDCPRPYGNHPLIDNNIHYAGINVVHDGYEYNRLEKIELICAQCQTYNLPKPQLRVCRSLDGQGKNCNRCFNKCLLTINNLLAVGQDPTVWGFNSINAAIQKTKKLFGGQKKLFKKQGGLWDWECITQKIKREIAQKDSMHMYPSAYISYLSWLSTLNLELFCRESKQEYLHKKPYYQELWKLAFTQDSAALFALNPSATINTD